jgi:hypothetical protein
MDKYVYNKNESYSNQPVEVIITSVDYGDFLDQTLPFTLPHADRVVVVTSFDDSTTQEVCRKWSVECIPTDTFNEKGEVFNKGNGINIGLSMLRQNGWILSMDADIVLPLTFRNMLAKSGLDTNSIYGCNRLNVVGWDAWKKLKSDWHDNPQFAYSCLINTPSEFALGATLVHKQYGYTPIGFFQLWHSSYMNRYQLRYPNVQGSAEKDDVQWALRWPRKQRCLLPTVRVFHLESEKSEMGANWNGRTTKTFMPYSNYYI